MQEVGVFYHLQSQRNVFGWAKVHCQLLYSLAGLHLNKERPTDKLPYKGAWLWVGAEMIHLMELPNPDPLEGRPEHGGRDR